MSFSFSAQGADKAAAKAAVAAKMDEVVQSQAVHAKARDLVVATAGAALDQLVDAAEGEMFTIHVNGGLGWRAEGEFTSASVGASASLHKASA